MICLSSGISLASWQTTTDPFVGKVVVGVKVRLLSMFTRPARGARVMAVTVALNIPHSSTSPTLLSDATKVILSACGVALGHIPLKAEPVHSWATRSLQL